MKKSLKDLSENPIYEKEEILKNFNDLEFQFSQVKEYWDFNKNIIKINEITSNLNKKAYWICKQNHSYEQLIKNALKRGFKCPICANRQLLSGYNDFETRYSELAKEWNYEKNILKPNQVFPGSLKKVWWKHDITINNKKYIHEWESVVYSRTSGNKGCPYCGGRKVLKGFNDFQSHYPELAKEWDYQLNNCKPDEITYGSNKKIHWICSKNHKYEAYVPDRRQGDGCPICSLKLRTSKPEKAIYFYLKKLFPDSICNYKQNWLGRKELDIYIPSLKLAMEMKYININ